LHCSPDEPLTHCSPEENAATFQTFIHWLCAIAMLVALGEWYGVREIRGNKMVQSGKATPRKKLSCTSGYENGLPVQIPCGAAVPTADIRHGDVFPMCSRGQIQLSPAKKWECMSVKWVVCHTSAFKNPNNQVDVTTVDLRIHLDLNFIQRLREATHYAAWN
jgi:hypothetical protein